MADHSDPALNAEFSMSQLAALIEAHPAGIACHAGERLLLVNQAMCELTGYSRQQLLAMKFWELFHPRMRDTVKKRGQSRIHGMTVPKRYEVALLTAQGEERWADLVATLLTVDGQKINLGSYLDTTERKRAETLQKQTQQMLAQIIDSSPVPTFVIDKDHLITHWNKACEHILGFTGADMVGTRRQQKVFYGKERSTMADLIVDGGMEKRLSQLYGDKRLTRSQFVAGAYEAEDFFPNLGEDGVWLYFAAAPLTDGDGQVIGAVETLQDFTDQRLAESGLIKSKRELEQLVAARGEQLRAATHELELDISRREAAEAELLQRFNEVSALNAELKQTQQQLLQSEKQASIGQLAAGVAHEINNPIAFVHSNLGSLQAYTRNLLELLEAYREGQDRLCTPDHSCEGSAEWKQRIRQLASEIELDYLKDDIPLLLRESKEGIARVMQIVADLKDFSRVDSDQKWEWADLRTGLDSTLNIVANEIRYRADVLKDYGELPRIKCLPSQINQVFMNLLVNAAQAMPKGRHGTITIRCGTDAAGVWVEIADTGTGIPPEKLSRIFDPFFTTKPIGKGTGLGLSLSYGIVQKHGGRIEVKSEVGKGTTFTVWLPIDPNAANDGDGAVPPAPAS